jgi:hypothetical protein
MARGFDSKSVEEQQAAFAAKASGDGVREVITPEEAARRRERESLQLSRKQVVAQLAAATAPRHREMLEQALAELDNRLAQTK